MQNLVCQSPKFPDYQGQGYCAICCKISQCELFITYLPTSHQLQWVNVYLELDL